MAWILPISALRTSQPSFIATAAAVPAPSPIQQTMGIILYADCATWVVDIVLPGDDEVAASLGDKTAVRNMVAFALGDMLYRRSRAVGTVDIDAVVAAGYRVGEFTAREDIVLV